MFGSSTLWAGGSTYFVLYNIFAMAFFIVSLWAAWDIHANNRRSRELIELMKEFLDED